MISTWRIDGDGSGWTRSYTISSNYDAYGVAVTSDPYGSNVYTAGVAGSAFGKNTVILAYNGTTGNPLWQRVYTNGGVNADDVPVQILTDGTYVYVAGNSDGSSQFGSSTSADFFLVKLYASDGTSVWGNQSNGSPVAARYDGPAHSKDYVSEMLLLSSETGTQYVYVAGTFVGTGTGADYAVIRFEASNGTQSASARTSLTGDETCTSMALGGNRIFLTGYATTAVTNTVDYVTWAYSTDLVQDANWPATGAVFDAGVGGVDLAQRIVYSGGQTAVFVTGEAWRGSANYDIATIKLNASNGQLVTTWNSTGVRYFDNAAGEDRPSDMVIDKCGHIYIGGRTFNGSNLDFVGISYKGDTGAIRWVEYAGGNPTGRLFVTHGGSGNGADFAGAIRVTLEAGGLVNHAGDVFLFGQVTASGSAQKYGVARFDQLDPCDDNTSCCN